MNLFSKPKNSAIAFGRKVHLHWRVFVILKLNLVYLILSFRVCRIVVRCRMKTSFWGDERWLSQAVKFLSHTLRQARKDPLEIRHVKFNTTKTLQSECTFSCQLLCRLSLCNDLICWEDFNDLRTLWTFDSRLSYIACESEAHFCFLGTSVKSEKQTNQNTPPPPCKGKYNKEAKGTFCHLKNSLW